MSEYDYGQVRAVYAKTMVHEYTEVNIVPVPGAYGEWCLYMSQDKMVGTIGHRCQGFEDYLVTKAFYFNEKDQIRLTCKKCQDCGEGFPDYVIGFANFLH